MVKIVFWGFIDHALGTQTEAELNILAQKQRETALVWFKGNKIHPAAPLKVSV